MRHAEEKTNPNIVLESIKDDENAIHRISDIEIFLLGWVKDLNSGSRMPLMKRYANDGFSGTRFSVANTQGTKSRKIWINEIYPHKEGTRFAVLDLWVSVDERESNNKASVYFELKKETKGSTHFTTLKMELAQNPDSGKLEIRSERYLQEWYSDLKARAARATVKLPSSAKIKHINLIWVPEQIQDDMGDTPDYKLAIVFRDSQGYKAAYLEDFDVPLGAEVMFDEPRGRTLLLSGFSTGLGVSYRLYRDKDNIAIDREIDGEADDAIPPEVTGWTSQMRLPSNTEHDLPIYYSEYSPSKKNGSHTRLQLKRPGHTTMLLR